MLRPSFFMQNLTTTHLTDLRDRGQIIVPAGRGRTSFIDVRDVGAAAAVVLTENGHLGCVYSLTGAAALSYYDCAAILSRASGRTITYTDPSGRAFAAHMRKLGLANEFVRVMRGIYLICKLGLAARVTDELPRLIGRPPISFERFARQNAALIMGSDRHEDSPA